MTSSCWLSKQIKLRLRKRLLALASVNASVYAQLLLFVLALFLLLFWLLFVTLFQLFHSLLFLVCLRCILPSTRALSSVLLRSNKVEYEVCLLRHCCCCWLIHFSHYTHLCVLWFVLVCCFISHSQTHRQTDRQADGQTGGRTDGRTRCCCVLAAFYFLFIIITAIMATICLACGFLRGESQVQGHCCWIAGLLVLLVTRFCLVCFFHFILYIFKTYCTKQTS